MARDSSCNAPLASALQLAELEKSHCFDRQLSAQVL